jgi:hypothetical protein
MKIKINYSPKTDYLEFFFKNESGYFEASDLSPGSYTTFIGDDSKEVIGYGIYDAVKILNTLDDIDSHIRFAVYSYLIKKKYRISQEEFFQSVKREYTYCSNPPIEELKKAVLVAPYIYLYNHLLFFHGSKSEFDVNDMILNYNN